MTGKQSKTSTRLLSVDDLFRLKPGSMDTKTKKKITVKADPIRAVVCIPKGSLG